MGNKIEHSRHYKIGVDESMKRVVFLKDAIRKEYSFTEYRFELLTIDEQEEYKEKIRQFEGQYGKGVMLYKGDRIRKCYFVLTL